MLVKYNLNYSKISYIELILSKICFNRIGQLMDHNNQNYYMVIQINGYITICLIDNQERMNQVILKLQHLRASSLILEVQACQKYRVLNYLESRTTDSINLH